MQIIEQIVFQFFSLEISNHRKGASMQIQSVRQTRTITVMCLSASMMLTLCQLPTSAASSVASPYILIGGQAGTWFTNSQSPRFLEMAMSSGKVVNLTNDIPSPQSGSIWTGATNGSQWLVSGFCCPTGNLHSPQIALFGNPSLGKIPFNASLIDRKMAAWWGGDIFTASFGNKGNWLVAGLGSGCLPSYQPGGCPGNQSLGCGNNICYNHMSLGLFNGSNFIDLSGAQGLLPEQNDFILYASAWNGHYWLVGGGYQSNEILFRFNPITSRFTFLTPAIEASTGRQGAITSIAWNGKTWLIGGMGFLASYNGKTFASLTSGLNAALPTKDELTYPNSVNQILWDAQTKTWVLGGGLPIALVGSPESAWVASYKSGDRPAFKNVPAITASVLSTPQSSVLSLAYSGKTLIVAGYDSPGSNRGMILFYDNTTDTVTNMTTSLGNMGYVDWAAAG